MKSESFQNQPDHSLTTPPCQPEEGVPVRVRHEEQGGEVVVYAQEGVLEQGVLLQRLKPRPAAPLTVLGLTTEEQDEVLSPRNVCRRQV